MKKNSWIPVLFLTACYLLPLIFRPLFSPEEFRYAELAREMLVRGDLITPKLLDMRYFEAMPMSCWITAGSFKLFGQNAFALRLIPLLGSLGCAFLLWLWCRKRQFSSETGLTAALLYLGGSMTWFLGTFAVPDALFAMWTTAVTVSFAIALESGKLQEKLFFLAAAGIALGCGFLTKGVAAFALTLLPLIVYLLWQKRWKELLFCPWLPLLLALAVIAPWAMAIHKAEPDFWHHFGLIELSQRGAALVSGANAATFWLLLPFFFIGLFPAAFPVLSAMPHMRKNSWSDIRNAPEGRFAFVSLLLSLVVLTVFCGNQPSCVLPCFAPAAMLGALIMEKTDTERTPAALRRLTTVSSVLFIIIGSLILLAELFYLLWGTGFVPVLPLKIAVWTPFLTTAALGMIISGTIFFIYRRAKLPEPGSYFLLYGVVMLICVWFLPGFTAYYRMPEYELLEIASQLSAEKVDRPRIITYPKLMYSAAWCFKDSSVQLINSPGEMEYGHKNAVARGERPLVLNYNDVKQKLDDPKRKEGILIILLKEHIEHFNQHLPAGKQFTTAGDICAFHYPAQQEGKEKQ